MGNRNSNINGYQLVQQEDKKVKQQGNQHNNAAAAAIEQLNVNSASSGNPEAYSKKIRIEETIQEMYDLNVEIANDIIKIANTQIKGDKKILIERLRWNESITRLNKLEAILKTATDDFAKLKSQESSTSSVNLKLENLEIINKIKELNFRAIKLMTTDITQINISELEQITKELMALTTFTYVHVPPPPPPPMGGRRRKSNKVFKNKNKNKNKKRKYSKSRN